jgi:type IV secretory pathway VirB2 component (pilin)
MFGAICYGLYFMSKGPEQWVMVLACGVVLFGLGLSAAMMAPFVGYTQVFHQVIQGNLANTVYVNEIIVYTMGEWTSRACWGIAVGGGFLFMIAGFLLQTKQARAIANKVQAERIQAEEIDFRKRDRK